MSELRQQSERKKYYYLSKNRIFHLRSFRLTLMCNWYHYLRAMPQTWTFELVSLLCIKTVIDILAFMWNMHYIICQTFWLHTAAAKTTCSVNHRRCRKLDTWTNNKWECTVFILVDKLATLSKHFSEICNHVIQLNGKTNHTLFLQSFKFVPPIYLVSTSVELLDCSPTVRSYCFSTSHCPVVVGLFTNSSRILFLN